MRREVPKIALKWWRRDIPHPEFDFEGLKLPIETESRYVFARNGVGYTESLSSRLKGILQNSRNPSIYPESL